MSQSLPTPSHRPARWSVLANTAIVAVTYLTSRMLGLIREAIITARFGTTPAIDAYQAAFAIPDLLYLVIMGGALGSAFIPVFSAAITQSEDRTEAWELANTVLTVAMLAMLTMCAVVFVAARPLMDIIYDFPPEQLNLSVQLLRILLIQPVLLGIGGLTKATLESFDRFSLPALGANLYNVGIIAGAALLAPWFGIYGLVMGVLIGAALFLGVQVAGIRQIGWPVRLRLNWLVPGLKKIGTLLGPRVFGQSAWQIGLIVTSGLASTLDDGQVRANGVAYQIMLLPHGLLALSLGTVMFPQLSRAYAAGDMETFRQMAVGTLRRVLYFTLPAAVILAVLRYPVIRLMFERGAFDGRSTAFTADALLFYAVGLAAFAGAEIAVRTFYAMSDTKRPVIVGVATVVLNIVLANVLLAQGYGMRGLTLAFSLAIMAEFGALLVLLRRDWGTLNGLVGALARMLLAALLMAGVLVAALHLSAGWLPMTAAGDAYRWPWDFLPLAGWTVAASILGGAVYTGTTALLGLPEWRFLMRFRRTQDKE